MELQILEENLKKFISDPDSTNQLVKARDLAEEILQKNSKSNYANYVLALDDIEYCNYEEAAEKLKKIIEYDPTFEEAYIQLSMLYDYEGKKEEKFEILIEAYKHCKDNYIVAYEYACQLLHDYGELEESTKILADCVKKLPQLSGNWANLGVAYMQSLEIEMAKECFITALHLDKDNLMAIMGLGVYFFENSDFTKAKEFYEKTLEIDPNSLFGKFNLAVLELISGDMTKGLELYEDSRDKKKFLEKYGGERYPELKKKDLKNSSKKIIVMREQGFGDDIMACRYLKCLIDKNHEVSLAAHESTINFFKSIPELDQIKIQKNFKELDENTFDFRVFMMSLPFYFWKKSNIPPEPLGVDNERLKKFNPKFLEIVKKYFEKNEKKRIAVAWAGNHLHKRHLNRCIQLEIFSQIFANDDFEFYVIQKNISKEDQKIISKFPNVTLVDKEISDFSQSALLLNSMDKVITVDTSLIHLAGTLNKKSLLLLPKIPDWRWGLKGNTSMWYPSVRIARQQNLNDWNFIGQKVDKFLFEN